MVDKNIKRATKNKSLKSQRKHNKKCSSKIPLKKNLNKISTRSYPSTNTWRCIFCNSEFPCLPKQTENECSESPDGLHEIKINDEE